MDSVLAPILGELDTNLLIFFAVLMGACILFAILKKAIKIAIVVGCLMVASIALIPYAQSFQEKFKFSVDAGVATLVIDGAEYTLDRELIEHIKIENKGFDGYDVEFTEEDGVTYVQIPTYLVKSITDFADKYKIDYQLLE